jgi:hypothetical protein
MRPGVVELLASTGAVFVIFTGLVVWAQFQPKPAQAPVATASVPSADKSNFSLIAPAAAADARIGNARSAKASGKSKKAKKPNRSIAQAPKVPTP